jgi:hypothetical protein
VRESRDLLILLFQSRPPSWTTRCSRDAFKRRSRDKEDPGSPRATPKLATSCRSCFDSARAADGRCSHDAFKGDQEIAPPWTAAVHPIAFKEIKRLDDRGSSRAISNALDLLTSCSNSAQSWAAAAHAIAFNVIKS